MRRPAGGRVTNPPRPPHQGIIGVAAGAGDAAEDAGENAFQNQSSPVRPWSRRGRLRAPSGRKDPSGRNASTGQNVPSAPNTGRLRDTSPSFCRESPSPSISAGCRLSLRQRAEGLILLRLKTSLPSPLPRFFPTMSLYLPSLPNSNLRLTRSLRELVKSIATPSLPIGSANRSD